MTDEIKIKETPMPKPTIIVPVPADVGFPIPAFKFMQTLVDTHDEIWTKLLMMKHGRENHLMSEWKSILDSYRNQPAL